MDSLFSFPVGLFRPLQHAVGPGALRFATKRTNGSRISGMRAIGRTDGTTALLVFACGYKMAQECQGQSWPIKYH